jgi:glutathione S-transferase
LDENLYWCLIYSRWVADDTWLQIKQTFFGSMPFPLNKIVPILARRDVISAAHKQGIGRHSVKEITLITRETLQALSILPGKSTYFLGETPSTFDATVFAFLSQFTLVSIDDEFTRLAHEYGNLVAYCENIQAKYYGELQL